MSQSKTQKNQRVDQAELGRLLSQHSLGFILTDVQFGDVADAFMRGAGLSVDVYMCPDEGLTMALRDDDKFDAQMTFTRRQLSLSRVRNLDPVQGGRGAFDFTASYVTEDWVDYGRPLAATAYEVRVHVTAEGQATFVHINS